MSRLIPESAVTGSPDRVLKRFSSPAIWMSGRAGEGKPSDNTALFRSGADIRGFTLCRELPVASSLSAETI
jgi:hypothetical protein